MALAQSDDPDTCRVIGMATHDIEDNTDGYVTTFGTVRDVDTSTGGLSAGDDLWLSSTVAGAYTNVRPGYPDCQVIVGKVQVSNVSVGTVTVSIHDMSPARPALASTWVTADIAQVVTATVPEPIEATTWASGELRGFTASNGGLTSTVTRDILVGVELTGSVETPSGPSALITLYVALNGSVLTNQAESDRDVSATGDHGHMGTTCHVVVSNGDLLQAWTRSTQSNVRWDHLQLKVTEVK